MDVLVRMRRASSVHGSQAAYEAYAQDEPWVRGHESVAPSVHVQGARGHADDADAETSVHECVVQVAALEVGHAAVLARLAVEDEVDAEQGGAEDAGAVDEALAEIALGHRVVGGLLVGAAEGGAEAGDIVGGGERGCLWGEEVGALVERRDVERAGEDGLRLLGGSLAKGCGDGEGPPEEEGHGCVRCRVCRCRSGELLMDVNEDSKVMTCMRVAAASGLVTAWAECARSLLGRIHDTVGFTPDVYLLEKLSMAMHNAVVIRTMLLCTQYANSSTLAPW